MAGAVFVDTWGWVALGHHRDSRHAEVRRQYQRFRRTRARVYTSDFVLDEVTTLLFRREAFPEARRFLEGVFLAADQGQLTVERITSARFAEAWKMRLRYHDKPLISFTDLTSMALMSELGITKILTDDDHFLHVGLGFQKLP